MLLKSDIPKDELEEALKIAQIGMWSYDVQGEVFEVDDCIQQRRGINKEKIPLDLWKSMIHKDDVESAMKKFTSLCVQEDGIEEGTIEFQLITNDFVKNCVGTVRDKHGEIEKLVGVETVTQDKRNIKKEEDDKRLIRAYELIKGGEEMLIYSREAVMETTKSKSLFLATLSHEIRTPLNGIVGALNLLIGSELDKKQLSLVKSISETCTLLCLLINDFLDICKIEAGRMRLDIKPLDLVMLVEETVKPFEKQAQEKGLEFKKDIDTFDFALIGDGNRIAQIIKHILENSIAFTEQGFIMVSLKKVIVEKNKVHVLMKVEDSGIPVPEHSRDLMFKAFNQGARGCGGVKKHGGSGLQMSLSRKLAQLMKGDLEMESGRVTGALYNFNIDFDSTPFIKGPHQTRIVPTGQETSKILILGSSDSHYCTKLRNILKDQNCFVDTCDTVKDAKLALKDEYGLIFVDDQWEDAMNSNEMLAAFKESVCSQTPVIAINESGEYEHGEKWTEHMKREIEPQIVLKMMNKYLYNPENDQMDIELSKELKDLDAQMREPSPAPKKKAQSMKILIVDDNQTNLFVFGRMLERLGYEYETAENGIRALDILKRSGKNFGLIFMDLNMPIKGGQETTNEIRHSQEISNGRDVPIICTSADEDDKIFGGNFTAYLRKPIKMDDLQQIITEHGD